MKLFRVTCLIRGTTAFHRRIICTLRCQHFEAACRVAALKLKSLLGPIWLEDNVLAVTLGEMVEPGQILPIVDEGEFGPDGISPGKSATVSLGLSGSGLVDPQGPG